MAHTMGGLFGTFLIILSTCILLGRGIPLDCYRTTPSRYDGHQQTTINGDACVRWDSFDNDFRLASNFPDATVADAANYCRNPDKDENLWCFTGKMSTSWNICGIKKCEYVNVDQCGRLSIEQPTILGRNVLFTFTPDTSNSNAILEWQRTNKINPWATLPVKYKFTQYFQDGTYYLLLTDTVRYDDEVYYRIYYDNKSVRCLMETPELVLKDISSNPCGFVYLRTKKVKVNDMVELEYYPSKNAMRYPDRFLRQWTQFTNHTIPIQLKEDTYMETQEPNDKYVLTINMSSYQMNGLYKVYCGTEASYSNAVRVALPDPPSSPLFEGLQDIDDCKGCIVGEDGDHFSVLCKTSGGTEPVIVTVSIGNEPLSPQRYDVTPGYIAFFYLRKRHHMEVLTCSVMNDALTSPLIVTTRVYIKHAPEIEFNISGSELNISKGEQTFVKCSAKSAPASNISWIESIDGRNITKKQCHMTTNCVIAIVEHLVPQRHLFCQTHYLHKTDRKKLTIYILDAPEIEFNISGSELNISKGEQTFVKCSAKSALALDISWIERIDGRDIKKKQCHMTTYCVIAIDAHLVPQRHLFCQTHYLHKIDRKDLTVYILDAPEIEFNISGSELNISKGEQTFVKCSAKSALALNISWIERIDGRDITKKQCHMTTYCVIAIDAHLVPQRNLFCQTHYLHNIDRKDLTVYILWEDDQLSKDQEDSVSGVKLIFWIIVGPCIAIVAVVSIVVIIVCLVVRNKQRKARAQQETNRVIYSTSDDGDRGELDVKNQEYAQLRNAAHASGQSETVYSQLQLTP
ncbi:uncharacterized protein LOC123559684 isoform X2 [Mercenaria mercenaria]|uniref:uncharacterized protein LOC123559684 isoform X2 n=1 Tax=Mercenaria mercenaria TaxID=6596 RepID=UPI00234F66C4|nr:uncharacterized protein LOC123559684 isoform X2 [Mercenaria mercenaria]